MKVKGKKRNYRTFSKTQEEYYRAHPEEIDSYLATAFEEYAVDGCTPALLSSLRMIARVKGISAIAEETVIKIGMSPPHPGDFIRTEILDELKLSIAKAAEILGVRRATLSNLVNQKSSLSAEMALRIEKAFGVSMDTLLRMQAWFDSDSIRKRSDEIDVKPYSPGQ